MLLVRRLPILALACLTFSCVTAAVLWAQAPASEIHTEYLMTFVAPLNPVSEINNALSVSNVNPTGSWAKGPRIKGTFVPPGGDWSRVLPSGATRIDVRLTLRTDDGALIYISYNGIFKEAAASEQKMNRGEVLAAKDVDYWIVAPTFETSSPQYAWLNSVQAVAKMVEYKDGKDGYVKYDVFLVR